MTMDIYIEYVIIDNMVFNSLILYFTLLSIKLRVNRIRLFCAGSIGTAVAMILPLLYVENFVAILIKLCLAIVMVLVALSKYSIKLISAALSLFIAYTFVLGGAIIGVFFIIGVPFNSGLTINYVSEIPMGIYIGAVAVCIYLAARLYKYLNNKKEIISNTINCRLTIAKLSFDIVGLYDSGNSLTDNTNGKLVCFLADKTIKNKVKQLIASNLLSKDVILNTHYLQYATVSGTATAVAVDASIQILNICFDISLAISKTCSDNYQLILNSIMQTNSEQQLKAS